VFNWTKEKRRKFNGASKWHGDRDLRAIDEWHRSIRPRQRIDALATGHYYRGQIYASFSITPTLCAFILLFLPRRADVSRQRHPHRSTVTITHRGNPRQLVLPFAVTQFRNARTPFSAVTTIYLSPIAAAIRYNSADDFAWNPATFVYTGRLTSTDFSIKLESILLLSDILFFHDLFRLDF